MRQALNYVHYNRVYRTQTKVLISACNDNSSNYVYEWSYILKKHYKSQFMWEQNDVVCYYQQHTHTKVNHGERKHKHVVYVELKWKS